MMNINKGNYLNVCKEDYYWHDCDRTDIYGKQRRLRKCIKKTAKRFRRKSGKKLIIDELNNIELLKKLQE